MSGNGQNHESDVASRRQLLQDSPPSGPAIKPRDKILGHEAAEADNGAGKVRDSKSGSQALSGESPSQQVPRSSMNGIRNDMASPSKRPNDCERPTSEVNNRNDNDSVRDYRNRAGDRSHTNARNFPLGQRRSEDRDRVERRAKDYNYDRKLPRHAQGNDSRHGIRRSNDESVPNNDKHKFIGLDRGDRTVLDRRRPYSPKRDFVDSRQRGFERDRSVERSHRDTNRHRPLPARRDLDIHERRSTTRYDRDEEQRRGQRNNQERRSTKAFGAQDCSISPPSRRPNDRHARSPEFHARYSDDDRTYPSHSHNARHARVSQGTREEKAPRYSKIRSDRPEHSPTHDPSAIRAGSRSSNARSKIAHTSRSRTSSPLLSKIEQRNEATNAQTRSGRERFLGRERASRSPLDTLARSHKTSTEPRNNRELIRNRFRSPSFDREPEERPRRGRSRTPVHGERESRSPSFRPSRRRALPDQSELLISNRREMPKTFVSNRQRDTRREDAYRTTGSRYENRDDFDGKRDERQNRLHGRSSIEREDMNTRYKDSGNNKITARHSAEKVNDRARPHEQRKAEGRFTSAERSPGRRGNDTRQTRVTEDELESKSSLHSRAAQEVSETPNTAETFERPRTSDLRGSKRGHSIEREDSPMKRNRIQQAQLQFRTPESIPTPISDKSKEHTTARHRSTVSKLPKDATSHDDSQNIIPQSDSIQSIYERIGQVGEGTYGKVYKARHRGTSEFVALKRIRLEQERDGFPITSMREIKLLQRLKHPSIVKLLEMMIEKGSVYMVFEYMDHDLTGILANPHITFEPPHIKDLASQLFGGLAHLHHRGVLHRDIKGSNILLNNAGELKLADFGLARFYQKSRRNADYTNRVITLWFRPPELLLGATAYDAAVDIWSAGCIFIELFTKTTIFPGRDEIHQLETIYKVMGTPTSETWPGIAQLPWYELIKFEQFPSQFESMLPMLSPAATALSLDILQLDPAKRPHAHEVLQHPYFTTEEPKALRRTLFDIAESHEWDTKQRRREDRVKKSKEEKEREAALGAGKSSAANTIMTLTTAQDAVAF